MQPTIRLESNCEQLNNITHIKESKKSVNKVVIIYLQENDIRDDRIEYRHQNCERLICVNAFFSGLIDRSIDRMTMTMSTKPTELNINVELVKAKCQSLVEQSLLKRLSSFIRDLATNLAMEQRVKCFVSSNTCLLARLVNNTDIRHTSTHSLCLWGTLKHTHTHIKPDANQ